MSRLRISGSISSLPHMPSWRQHRDNFTFTLWAGGRYCLLKIHGSQVSWRKAVTFIALIIANRTAWAVFPFSLLQNCQHAETLRRFEGGNDTFLNLSFKSFIFPCPQFLNTSIGWCPQYLNTSIGWYVHSSWAPPSDDVHNTWTPPSDDVHSTCTPPHHIMLLTN